MANITIQDLAVAATPLAGSDLTFVSRSSGILTKATVLDFRNYILDPTLGINGVPIGNTTPSSGSFTTLTSTGSTSLGPVIATSINGTPVGPATPSTGAFTTLSASGTTSLAALTATSINATPIGNSTPSSGSFTTVTITGMASLNGDVELGNAGTDTTAIVSQLSLDGSVGSAGQVAVSRGTGLSPQWVTSVNSATNVVVGSPDNSNATRYLTFVDSTGTVPIKIDSSVTPLEYNPSTNTITGNITGNAGTATSATSATSATTATNVSGGTASVTTLTASGTATLNGDILLGNAGTDTTTITSQLSANASVGTAGQFFTSRGANLSPQWTTPTTSVPTQVSITDDNASATRYLTFVDGTGNQGIKIDSTTTALAYNPGTNTLTTNISGTTITGSGTITGDTVRANTVFSLNGTTIVDSTRNLTNIAAITATGTVTANAFSGSGSAITNINAANIATGTLVVARGGTGVGTAPTNGQLLIGNGTGYSLNTLTPGTNVTISNGAGTITINAVSSAPAFSAF